MRNGLLLYAPEDIRRNTWFIRELCQNAELEGVSLRLCAVQADQSPETVFADAEPDLVLNRSRYEKFSEYCEETLRIPVYNSARVTAVTGSKFRTYQVLGLQHGIPMAETWKIAAGAPLPGLPLPLVGKPDDGHGGAGVTWIADAAALERYCQQTKPPFLLQKPVRTGWDMRIYVLGGEIYSAILRTSDTDFRSNFSLGGKVQAVQPDAEAAALVRRITAILPLDFAGVDLLRAPDGSYVLGEIEDAVGCRMLYQETALDPARDLIRYVCRKKGY